MMEYPKYDTPFDMPDLTPKPKPKKPRRKPGMTARQVTPMTLPINNGGQGGPHGYMYQPRDQDGKWTNTWMRPNVRGPVTLTKPKKLTPKRTSKGRPLSKRVMHLLRTIRHPYKSWKGKKIKQYKRSAKHSLY